MRLDLTDDSWVLYTVLCTMYITVYIHSQMSALLRPMAM